MSCTYLIFRIAGEERLFINLPPNGRNIDSGDSRFLLGATDEGIAGTFGEEKELPFSSNGVPVMGEIRASVVVGRHVLPYLLVGVTGRGLFGVGNLVTYVEKTIAKPIGDVCRRVDQDTISLRRVTFENKQLGERYWGKNIRARVSYDGDSLLSVRASSPKLPAIMEKNEELSQLLTGSNVTIKSIEGSNEELTYRKGENMYPGLFRVSSTGTVRCEFFDIGFFESFVRGLVDKGILGGSR